MPDQPFSVAAFILAAQRAAEPVKARLHGLARRAADRQYGLVKQAYPIGPSGILNRDVAQGQRNAGSFWVTANAPHVHLFELGADRTHVRPARGRMPAARLFVGLAIRHRDEMYREGQAILDQTHEVG